MPRRPCRAMQCHAAQCHATHVSQTATVVQWAASKAQRGFKTSIKQPACQLALLSEEYKENLAAYLAQSKPRLLVPPKSREPAEQDSQEQEKQVQLQAQTPHVSKGAVLLLCTFSLNPFGSLTLADVLWAEAENMKNIQPSTDEYIWANDCLC